MVPRRDLRREVVQGARHPRSVRVGQSDHAIDPARPELLHALVRADPVLDAPGVIVEPAPDGLRQPIGKEMHVRVDDQVPVARRKPKMERMRDNRFDASFSMAGAACSARA